MELSIQAAQEAVEPLTLSMRAMEQCFGRCQWRTVITVRQLLLKKEFSSLMPARRLMLLTRQLVSSCGITTRVAKEAEERRPLYTGSKFTSARIIVTKQVVSCWIQTLER